MPPPAPRPSIEARDLTFAYRPGEPVIRELSVAASPGRLVVVLGPNASGKSTLMTLLLGQQRPASGQVRIGGVPLEGLDLGERARRIAYVPQRGGAAFPFTVEEVVAMGRFAAPPDPGIVDCVLEACDLLAVRHRVYVELSVGQQQRVLLARAMAQVGRPEAGAEQGRVLLADEPASAMDLRHVHETMQRLRSIAAGGLAVMVVLHDPNLAARYADEVWLLEAGRLVAGGAWHEVLVPRVLEPVYGVKLQEVARSEDRPVFLVQ